MSNRCGAGYCSKGFSSNEVKQCQASLPDSWNGLCAYQNGRRVEGEEVALDCCETGCVMDAGRYARWNGLCAYQAAS